jgi:hypothetical protein
VTRYRQRKLTFLCVIERVYGGRLLQDAVHDSKKRGDTIYDVFPVQEESELGDSEFQYVLMSESSQRQGRNIGADKQGLMLKVLRRWHVVVNRICGGVESR